MYNILILLAFTSWLTKASTNEINVYCGEWPTYCENDGGLYFDIASIVYNKKYKINKVVQPYKRAISSMQHDRTGIILGTYKNEIKNFSYSKMPVSVDIITAYMSNKNAEKWLGIDSITNTNVLLQKFWRLDEALNISSYVEIDRRETAYKLILMGRYKYFITDSSGFEQPPKGLQIKLIKKIYTYPAFSHSPDGYNLQRIWESRILELYRSGRLFEIYSKYHSNIQQWTLVQHKLERLKHGR